MTPGIHCDFTLAHAAVNAGAETGFHLAAERGQKEIVSTRRRRGGVEHTATGGSVFADFGVGPREWRLKVRFSPTPWTAARLRRRAARSRAARVLRAARRRARPAHLRHRNVHRSLRRAGGAHLTRPGAAAVVVLVEAV
ncbi:MAG: hypothetical protein WKH64_16750 [Chloroflexia bacterium]